MKRKISPITPGYSGTLQRALLTKREGEQFFQQWKDKAIQFDIDVVRMPLDYEAWYLWAASGRNIVYGTELKLAKSGIEWQPSGKTRHCRTAGFPVRTDGSISDTNSWNDGTGFMKPSVAKAVIAKSHPFGAFGIYKIAPRNAKPDYSGLGG
jgi:hypothetical protein